MTFALHNIDAVMHFHKYVTTTKAGIAPYPVVDHRADLCQDDGESSIPLMLHNAADR